MVAQREVGLDTKGFLSAMRAAMRQDPDVILVGELRDVETITTALMAAVATGVYLAWALPARNSYLAAHPGAGQEQLIAHAYPAAMTALTLFACFCAIFLILLIVPPSDWWSGGAPVVRGDWRMVGVVAFLFVFLAVVLAVPLFRTLFEITALPVWQYVVLCALAFVWSQLCLLVWKWRLLDRWLGSAEDPGNVCAKGAAPKPT